MFKIKTKSQKKNTAGENLPSSVHNQNKWLENRSIASPGLGDLINNFVDVHPRCGLTQVADAEIDISQLVLIVPALSALCTTTTKSRFMEAP